MSVYEGWGGIFEGYYRCERLCLGGEIWGVLEFEDVVFVVVRSFGYVGFGVCG